MESTGLYEDSKTGRLKQLNRNVRANYFSSTVVGEITYGLGHSYCKGAPGTIGPNQMVNLVVTENLEVVMNNVTIRENFQTGDIEVLEMGTTIRAPAWQDQGLITDFGTLTAKNCPALGER